MGDGEALQMLSLEEENLEMKISSLPSSKNLRKRIFVPLLVVWKLFVGS